MKRAVLSNADENDVWKNSCIAISATSIILIQMFVFRIVEGLRYTHLDAVLRALLHLFGFHL